MVMATLRPPHARGNGRTGQPDDSALMGRVEECLLITTGRWGKGGTSGSPGAVACTGPGATFTRPPAPASGSKDLPSWKGRHDWFRPPLSAQG
jgi:hypothetical protein